MSVYFGKELPDQAIYIGGAPIRFHCLKTDDAYLIGELRKAAKNSIGGVFERPDEAAYAECIKKKTEEQSQKNSRNSRSTEISPAHLPQLSPTGAHAAGDGSRRPVRAHHNPAPPTHGLPDPLMVPDPKV